MPGRRLSDEERALQHLWDNPTDDIHRPYLESIAISGGLRGIHGLYVPFRYPVTALCGKNGVGKSTILALAALAYHSPAGWRIPNWLHQPKSKAADRSYYTFEDFFLRASSEQSFDGVSVTWTYRHSRPTPSVKFRKTPTRWGRYTARPEREVAFSPLRRLIPAHEIAGVRSAFANQQIGTYSSSLTSTSTQQLSYIMGRIYSSAEIQEIKRHALQRARSGVEFTGFNMGSGESWIINLLHTLQELPTSSLLLIEEIEAGLHPEAQVRLAEILVEVCLKRKTQIVCSTHSEAFLDALPRQARILLSRQGDNHEAIESPSTRFAIHEMSGVFKPELVLYCEDFSAKALIEEALPYGLRNRTDVREVGSNETVVRQGVSHLRSGYTMRAMCVLDGDCSESDIKKAIAKEAPSDESLHPEYIILPGALPPEQWVMEQLLLPDYHAQLATQFGCSIGEADTLIESIRSEIDYHNLGHRLEQLTGIESRECLRRVMRSVAPLHPQLQELRERIKAQVD